MANNKNRQAQGRVRGDWDDWDNPPQHQQQPSLDRRAQGRSDWDYWGGSSQSQQPQQVPDRHAQGRVRGDWDDWDNPHQHQQQPSLDRRAQGRSDWDDWGGSSQSQQPQQVPDGRAQGSGRNDWDDWNNPPQQSQQQPQHQRMGCDWDVHGDDIAQGMSRMQVSVQRCGTRGRPCKLKVNYLPVILQKLCDKVYHYDVRFDPDATKKLFTPAVDLFMAKNFRGIVFAHDGRNNLYTTSPLNFKEALFEDKITVPTDRPKEYIVKVQFAREIDMKALKNFPSTRPAEKPFEAIAALNIIIRKAFRNLITAGTAVQSGASLYFPPANPRNQSLGEGLDLWYGLFQSVVMGQKTIYLNVDVSHKGFPSAMSVLDVIRGFSRDGRLPNFLGDRDRNTLQAHLNMLELEYKGRKRRFTGLGGPADRESFEKDGKRMKITEYFTSIGERIQYPNYPVIMFGPIVKVPLEFCKIPGGQATNKKTTPNVTAAMIKFSATSTEERERKIMKQVRQVNYANDLRDFGVDVRTGALETVEGRVLNPPDLKYKNGTVRPARGCWNGKDFISTPNEEIKWAVINCDDRTDRNAIQTLIGYLLDGARRKKMPFAKAPDMIESLRVFDHNFQNNLNKIFTDCIKKGIKIAFLVIIDQNDCYPKIKQVAENRVGFMTQCIKANTVRRMDRNPAMTIDNIMLKVNAKLCGTNHQIMETSYQKHNKKNEGIMFVGADVTHAGPDQKDIPSIVGVVSSYDDCGFKYQCSWRMQKKLKKDNQIEEMILDLESIIVEHLDRYKKFNGTFPAKLMYHRDGVSEGQFRQVLDIELRAMQNAMKKKYGPDQTKHAKITFVVVQKRHHTRFFPTQREFTDGKFNNIVAGTIVDKDVVDPYIFQFFLTSHAAIQGVSKPTKYCILHDDSKFSADDLQAITYDLCHLFTRCNRSVSYPAPTYYAHLVAARGKSYTIGSRLNMSNLDREYNNRRVNDNFNNNFPMFFV